MSASRHSISSSTCGGLAASRFRTSAGTDGGAIAGLGDGENFESQLGVALEAAARVNADLMMASERQFAQLRINLRDKRALMSRIASVERDDARGIAAFPRRLPSFNASARGGHTVNLTRCTDKWKWFSGQFSVRSLTLRKLSIGNSNCSDTRYHPPNHQSHRSGA